MSVNRYEPHLLILPEDDANRQIANGFINNLNVKSSAIQVLPPAKGWGAVLRKFECDYSSKMHSYPERRMLLLIDYNDTYEARVATVKNTIPPILSDRVFFLGVKTEPEALKRSMGMSYEKIGTELTSGCPEELNAAWQNSLLVHNIDELRRMVDLVKWFLFAE